jgi:conjugal transfer pilus assembly protein TraF
VQKIAVLPIFCTQITIYLLDNAAMNHYCALRFLLLIIILGLPVGLVCAAETELEGMSVSYFADKQRGWFWYEVLPESVEKKPAPEPETKPTKPEVDKKTESKPNPNQAQAPTPVTAEPGSKSASPIDSASLPLSSAWLRKNMENYLNKAIDEPSQENVAAFYYLQRVMMDKAERFTNAARYVVMSDPQLDETVRRPVATYAANEANHQASVMADKVLKSIASQAGILFFFRSDCPYCHVQAPVLSMLENAYGFKIYPVSLDGRAMPNGLFRQFKLDQGQAALLGVTQTPALFLMKPPKQIVPLSQGALSLEELTSRVLLAAKKSGWIADSQYQTTQGIRSTPMLLPTTGSINPVTAQDPALLIQALQQSAKFEGQP